MEPRTPEETAARKLYYVGHRATGDLPAHFLDNNGAANKSISDGLVLLTEFKNRLRAENRIADFKAMSAMESQIAYIVNFAKEMRDFKEKVALVYKTDQYTVTLQPAM